MLEDADGSLLVVDTGSWYVQHCPTGKIRKVEATGGIYRVRQSRGCSGPGPPRSEDRLGRFVAPAPCALLGDDRPTVRDRAQQAFTQRGQEAVATLGAVVLHGHNMLARQHAIWALAGITDDTSVLPLRIALDDSNPDIIVPAARALGLRRDATSARVLEQLLQHSSASVRSAAAEALARCGEAKSVAALWQALRQPDLDRFLEHALVHALFRRADTAALEAGLRDPHPRVQQAALILLDQPPRPKDQLRGEQVLSRLESADAQLRQAAVRSLRGHPEWAEQSLQLLRGLFEQAKLNPEQERSLRELTLAFQASGQVQDLLGQVVASASTRRRSPSARSGDHGCERSRQDAGVLDQGA